ncbi:hypothetical protein N665_0022s0001 [Sinapis alba]|nr:hypothetical protein N665_0022s0001 [Sinapis alba]
MFRIRSVIPKIRNQRKMHIQYKKKGKERA